MPLSAAPFHRRAALAVLVLAALACAALMAARLYGLIGAGVPLPAFYLVVPLLLAGPFALATPAAALRIALAVFALFVAVSLPNLVLHLGEADADLTLELHTASALLIALLHRIVSKQPGPADLAQLANTDAPTRLPNRRRMDEAIAAELLRFARYGHAFSVILIEIDGFDAAEHRIGPGGGERALVALAARAVEVLRDVDMLGRWDAGAFVVVLPETPFEDTLQKAAVLCSHVAAAPLIDAHRLTISCGVSAVAVGDSAEALLRRVGAALYTARRNGGNRAEGVPDRFAEIEPATV